MTIPTILTADELDALADELARRDRGLKGWHRWSGYREAKAVISAAAAVNAGSHVDRKAYEAAIDRYREGVRL
jgi:hypothetical protein